MKHVSVVGICLLWIVLALFAQPARAETYDDYLQAQQEAFDAQQAALVAKMLAQWRCIGNGVAPPTVALYTYGQDKYNQGMSEEGSAEAAGEQQNWTLGWLYYTWAKISYQEAKQAWDNVYPN